jgi:long-chain acyl-CoA synthetase
MVFSGYKGPDDGADAAIDQSGWFHTGDLGEIDDDGYLTITGRAKEIIVTSGGKNVSPVVLEDRLRSHSLVSHCIVIGDDRPFVAALVTLDPIAVEQWRKHAADSSDRALRAAIQEGVDEANSLVSRAESIREFRVLDEDFTQESGVLTPSLKLRRAHVAEKYAEVIDGIYARSP